MIAIAAAGIVLAVLLRTGDELVRTCLIAGLWALPLLPVFAAWTLLVRLLIVIRLPADVAAVVSIVAGIGIVASAVALFVQLRRRQVPARIALIGIGLAFGLADLVLVFVVNAVS